VISQTHVKHVKELGEQHPFSG